MANEKTQSKKRVFLVDDHALVREQLAALLQGEADLEVCGTAADCPSAFAEISRQGPDLAILSMSLKRSQGLELLKALKTARPGTPVLVLSAHDEARYAERALQAGARGYITQEEATVNMLAAVRRVLGGELYLSSRMAGRVWQKRAGAAQTVGSPLEVLTEREWEVFRLMRHGMSSGEIARELALKIKTVESYRAQIREKLQSQDSEQLRQGAEDNEGGDSRASEKAGRAGIGVVAAAAARPGETMPQAPRMQL
jgi:DNA-binding NarL/FixJ family response regulator